MKPTFHAQAQVPLTPPLKLLERHGNAANGNGNTSQPVFSAEEDQKVIDDLIRMISCADPAEGDA